MNTFQTNWVWDDKTKTYKVGATVQCHTGNTEVYKHPKGGTLFIGGWNNGAIVTPNTHVIDLTGSEHRYYEMPVAYDEDSKGFLPFVEKKCAGWLSLPFPDMGTPTVLHTYEQWFGISQQINSILSRGTDVLVACLGGHGRSGLFCSIVGYILGVNSNRAWSSPVEHIRKIHCAEAVETFKQEEYVYQVLGLDIKISHAYAQTTNNRLDDCPLCGIKSIYVKDFGMCLGCQAKWAPVAEVKTDITEEDLDKIISHKCDDHKSCLGIWKASACGHTVHDMIIVDGYCETCNWDEKQTTNAGFGECAICEKVSAYGSMYGVCWDCSKELEVQQKVDYIHNTMTDAYRAVPHKCNSVLCNGVVGADICLHIVHDREVTDGYCEDCYKDKRLTEAANREEK